MIKPSGLPASPSVILSIFDELLISLFVNNTTWLAALILRYNRFPLPLFLCFIK